MRSLIALALYALCSTVGAQDWLRTETAYAEGRQRLQVSGKFIESDTVFVQVYHDGKELSSGLFVSSFTVVVDNADYCILKFTDRLRRVKRVSFFEISDDMVEFVPPFEVNFKRAGNLVYVKTSVGRPDFQEFDTGTSR